MPSTPRPDQGGGRQGARGPLALPFARESIGALAVLSLAVTALRHVIATDRQTLLWYDGDSVLLPLMVRSMRLGEAFDWAMSPSLFFFPELPVYMVCAAVTSTPQAALALNGVLIVVGLYVIVRVIAAQVMPDATRAARIVVGVLAVGIVAVLSLTESDGSTQTIEVASLLFLTTYYYGAVLAMLGTAAFALRVVRSASLAVPRPAPWALLGAGVLATLSTASDPLFVPWSAAPVIVTVALLALARRVPWSVVLGLGIALAGGSALGYGLRLPLRPFISLDPSTYVHPGDAGTALAFFAQLTDERAASSVGDAELVLLLALFAMSVAGAVWAWRTRASRTVLVAATLSVVTVLAVTVGCIVVGSPTPRYLEPIVTAPLIALVAVAELVRTAIRRTRAHRRGRGFGVLAAVVAMCLIATGIAVTPSTVTSVTTASYGPAACLDAFVGTSHRTGVGQYWTARPLATYTDPDVTLLQVRDDFTPYTWLVNLASYSGKHPTFVLVGQRDVWPTPIQDQLGDPTRIVHCPGYDVWDYAGTRGAVILRHLVVDAAAVAREGRGFPR